MEKKTDRELREQYEANYPAPTASTFLMGIVCLGVTLFNVYGAKLGPTEGSRVVSWLGVAFCACGAVFSLRRAWDYFDFNKAAEKFFNEEG